MAHARERHRETRMPNAGQGGFDTLYKALLHLADEA